MTIPCPGLAICYLTCPLAVRDSRASVRSDSSDPGSGHSELAAAELGHAAQECEADLRAMFDKAVTLHIHTRKLQLQTASYPD